MKAHEKDPSRRDAQGALATEVTKMVHGEGAKDNATGVSAILFSDFDPHNVKASVFDEMAKEIPTASVSANNLGLVDALVKPGLAMSSREASRQIEQGGVYGNQQGV